MKYRPVLEAIAEFCERRRISFVLVGAFGLAAYGLQRDTRDLDLMVEESASSIVAQLLQSLGYETVQDTAAFSIHRHTLREMGRVDLIRVDGATASQVFARARSRPLLGRTVLVPCPEHLAAMKVQAMANDPTRLLKDLADVQFLLRVPNVDRSEIRGYFQRYNLIDRYDEIVRILDEAL